MNNTYIPAPDGYQLAVWHFFNGESIHPLVGWLMQPHATMGAPIILDAPCVRVLHADDATYTEVVTPETVASFDLDRWADFVASTFERVVQSHTAALETAMATDGHADVSTDHGRYAAADLLVTNGRAQWVGEGYDRIKGQGDDTVNAAKWPEAPIIKVIHGRTCDSVEVVCPLCPRNHVHGADTGLRAAHCGGKHYRSGAGYVVTDPKGLLSEVAEA